MSVPVSEQNKNLSINSVEDLNAVLSRFPQIKTSTWIKDVSSLYNEIKNNECVLEIGKNGDLLRRVDVVMVKCFYTDRDGNRFQLVEEKQVFKNGKIRERGFDYVAEKLQAGENPEQSALRGLEEELQVSGPDIELTSMQDQNASDTKESPSYLGISSVYTKHVFSCNIPDKHYHENYVEVQPDKTNYFKWVKI